jgi:hypothetical protein
MPGPSYSLENARIFSRNSLLGDDMYLSIAHIVLKRGPIKTKIWSLREESTLGLVIIGVKDGSSSFCSACLY